jgi:hypothetical protein
LCTSQPPESNFHQHAKYRQVIHCAVAMCQAAELTGAGRINTRLKCLPLRSNQCPVKNLPAKSNEQHPFIISFRLSNFNIVNSINHNGYYTYHQLRHKELCILPSQKKNRPVLSAALPQDFPTDLIPSDISTEVSHRFLSHTGYMSHPSALQLGVSFALLNNQPPHFLALGTSWR